LVQKQNYCGKEEAEEDDRHFPTYNTCEGTDFHLTGGIYQAVTIRATLGGKISKITLFLLLILFALSNN
jgi:hypothetical protein